ncbi:TauD/TfdA family dioxygenase [Aliikangiella sp. G2MR2-5]|uniref:TauD/TfdA family dioxygenase n=1 Tax=Aliikangiella sp. G2MR2-5 TaxID=2788943 RepID=UPI0018A8F4D1|nr:TauD/TfdA family dioxygenase [Aliikangiella sp. G2MR2-5]
MSMINNSALCVQSVNDVELIVSVELSGMKLVDWIAQNRSVINEWVDSKGALVLRGLNLTSSRQFGRLVSQIFDEELLSYSHRSSPRTELKGNVYTSTEYHQAKMIVQHNEQAYTNIWPMRIAFFCLLPAEQGGETPIADSRVIYQEIPSEIREEFDKKGVQYVRNFSDIDLPWTEVFCTEDKKVVEQYCERNGIDYQWIGENDLRTKQVLPATAMHPSSGEILWFNQAHLFHSSTIGKELQQALLVSKGEEFLPRNAFYGDGSRIEDSVISEICKIYQENKFSFEWQKGDVMLLDNMMYSHGRETFKGDRKVLTAMTTPHEVKAL